VQISFDLAQGLIRLFLPLSSSRIVHSKKNHAVQAVTGRQGAAVANGSTVCEICDETPTDRVVSSCCGAAFCRSCVMDMMSLETLDHQDTNTRCPSCRDPFSIDLNQASQQIVDDSTLTISSSSGNDKAGMPSLKEMSHVASGSILRRIDLGEFATSTKVEVSGRPPEGCIEDYGPGKTVPFRSLPEELVLIIVLSLFIYCIVVL
jgi:hypothetical protein